MYEINMSTIMLIGIDDFSTKIIEFDKEFIINYSSKDIINNSCKYFGCSLIDRINMTKRLVNISSKSPIIIEESRGIIFFPLKSTREKNNIWISYNNLFTYEQNNKDTLLIFKNETKYLLNYSYYIVDNQVTRSMMLDYIFNKRKETLK